MKTRTRNAQHRTPNTELGSWRVAELSDEEYGYKREELIRIFVASIRTAEKNAK